MKFNDLTIRELRAQAIAACRKVVAQLPEDQKAKYDFLTVDFVEPDAFEEDDSEYFEHFTVLGRVWLVDETKLSFKADLVWVDYQCDLDGVDFIDVDIESLILQY